MHFKTVMFRFILDTIAQMETLNMRTESTYQFSVDELSTRLNALNNSSPEQIEKIAVEEFSRLSKPIEKQAVLDAVAKALPNFEPEHAQALFKSLCNTLPDCQSRLCRLINNGATLGIFISTLKSNADIQTLFQKLRHSGAQHGFFSQNAIDHILVETHDLIALLNALRTEQIPTVLNCLGTSRAIALSDESSFMKALDTFEKEKAIITCAWLVTAMRKKQLEYPVTLPDEEDYLAQPALL